jgi:hypothetical protein
MEHSGLRLTSPPNPWNEVSRLARGYRRAIRLTLISFAGHQISSHDATDPVTKIIMSSSSRRRDPGRKQTRAVDPHEESGGDEPPGALHSPPRAPHHAKKSQKQPTSIIKGDVHIKSVKGNVYLVQGSRDDERPQRSSTPTRNPPHHQQSARTLKRSTTQCDLSGTSEEDVTSASDDTEPEDVAPRQLRIPMPPPGRLRKHTEKKRDQADEGYHTSGTVSYTAQVSGKVKGKGKGKEKERSVSPVASSSRRTRRDSKMSRETVGEADESSSQSDADDRDEGSAEGDDEIEQTAQQDEDEDEASDDVCFCTSHLWLC